MSIQPKLYYTYILFWVCISATSFAQNPALVPVNTTHSATWQSVATWEKQNPLGAAMQLVLLHCNDPLNLQQKNTLAQAQITLLDYVGSNSYAAWLNASSRLEQCSFINGMSSFLPQYKIHPAILAQAKTQKENNILIRFYAGISTTQIALLAKQHKASIIPQSWQQKGLYLFRLNSKQLVAVASFYGLQYMSLPSQNIPLDLDGKGALGATICNMTQALGGKGLRGNDIVIAHGDNGSGIYHIDQSDRVINYNNGDRATHGILVNGIMGGDGIMDPAGQGIATEAKFVSAFFDAVLQLKADYYTGFNANLTNNSYAAVVNDCSYAGTYDNLSQYLDSMAFNTDRQLDVFSAGNDGKLFCGTYPSGYYNICGGYQTAKNILTVGSCSRNLILASSSSRGPLKDGRIKPEITAPGDNIYCPIKDNSYMFAIGTSLSCPQTTGTLALLTERYKQLNAGQNPKGNLLKAITINGASDLGNPGPDFWYGFGLIDAIRSLDIIENKHYYIDSIGSGAAAKTSSITVPANVAQLKVLLYYHDPAASAIASKQLVNDLNISVKEPGGLVTHYPLILNPSSTGVSQYAQEGIDHLNNVEQVIINNPSAGIYTVAVSDGGIPKGPQEYVICYDFVPKKLQLLFPIANAAAAANTDMYIYWDAPSDSINTTSIEYSIDNGSNWNTIVSALAPNSKSYQWAVPNINSSQCKIRIKRGTWIEESGAFMINQQPNLSLANTQCPGAIAINWTSVPNTEKYYVLLKKGAHLQILDSVNTGTLNYTIKGLRTDITYYVAVQASIGGMMGFRSKALAYKPDTGSCIGFAPGDLSLEMIQSPETGRRFTSSALSSASPIQIKVRNQDALPASNYSIWYQINTNPWQVAAPFSLAANSIDMPIVGTYDLSDTSLYTIKIAVKNNAMIDPVRSNDTLVKTIRHIANTAINLNTALQFNFENLSDLTLLQDSIGWTKDGYWDYSNNTDTGRLRTKLVGSKLIRSNRAMSMDVNMNNKRTVNFLTSTFNLSNYDTSADEIRFEFDYELRGMPIMKDSNKVWIRGNDTAQWIAAMQYDNAIDTTQLHKSGSISMRDLLRRKGQNFSTSSQIRFGQFDSTLIVDDFYGGGLSIDNFSLYKVSKDLMLSEIISPIRSDCAIDAAAVSIKIKNGSKNPMTGIVASYTLDGGVPISENIPGTIAGDDSLFFNFSTGLSGLSLGAHELSAWIHVAGDDYSANDSLLHMLFHISTLVDSFPYLQDFETNDGDWYTAGRNISWAYGVPNGIKIKTAASGTKVWKTNLNGAYNNNENAYLISPCISTIGLAKPILSFSTAMDIEDCAGNCDRVFVEYSTDNENSWQKLGALNQGTNWYNEINTATWSGTMSQWHVASSALPRANQLKLRFVIRSDMGSTFDGIAIDDIHIFDKQHSIAAWDNNNSSKSAGQAMGGNNWTVCTKDEEVFVAINPQMSDLGWVQSNIFKHAALNDPVQNQYVFPRSFLIQSAQDAKGLASLRLFVLDSEAKLLWADTNCTTCSKATDIYRMGISQYHDPTTITEDSSLRNNKDNGYHFWPYNKVKWVPYDNGYYAEIKQVTMGEYWLNDGGILGSLAANTPYINFKADKTNDSVARLNWHSNIDTQVHNYQIFRSTDSLHFDAIGNVNSIHNCSTNYQWDDQPAIPEKGKVYYKIQGTTEQGKLFNSALQSIIWYKGGQLINVYPIPVEQGQVSIQWTGAEGTNAQMRIYDALGKTIFENTLTAQKWLNVQTIDISAFAKGIYLLKMQIGANQFSKQLMIK
jgi:hypothetical protein